MDKLQFLVLIISMTVGSIYDRPSRVSHVVSGARAEVQDPRRGRERGGLVERGSQLGCLGSAVSSPSGVRSLSLSFDTTLFVS